MTDSPIIIALDVESASEARLLVKQIGDAANFYKVGLELYAAAGMELVKELKAEGHRVFLDLKMYDIDETVKRAVAQVARVGVDFLTIHAMLPAMRAAVTGRGSSSLKLLAVTVLTSLDDSDLKELGYLHNVGDLVRLRVKHAMEAGMDGIVSSPQEVSSVRAMTGSKMTLITPGVRSAGKDAGDQKRVMTPSEAMSLGADYLVIGRQVTRAADPRSEVQKISEELLAVQ